VGAGDRAERYASYAHVDSRVAAQSTRQIAEALAG
jgi:hypothetical protein